MSLNQGLIHNWIWENMHDDKMWAQKYTYACFNVTFLSGRLNRNSRSKRPGLLSAGSIESSLFVAPMTTISPRLSKPSIKARRVDTIELRTKHYMHKMKISRYIRAVFEIENIFVFLESKLTKKIFFQTVKRPKYSYWTKEIVLAIKSLLHHVF